MSDRYEFAELSYDKHSTNTDAMSCIFSLLNVPADDDNGGETHYDRPWIYVLPELGQQGWFIGGIKEYEVHRTILLQRKVETG